MDNTLTMGITLPRELRDRVDAVAEKDSVSVSEIVRRGLVLLLEKETVE